jgi:hypothetical protein
LCPARPDGGQGNPEFPAQEIEATDRLAFEWWPIASSYLFEMARWRRA